MRSPLPHFEKQIQPHVEYILNPLLRALISGSYFNVLLTDLIHSNVRVLFTTLLRTLIHQLQ